METVTLTKVFTTNKDKQGNQLMSKNNKPYTRMSIKCSEYGDKWVSGFQNQQNQAWKEGDKVEVIIKKNGEYLNFDVPKKEDKINEGMAEVLKKLGTIDAKLNAIYSIIRPETEKVADPNYPAEEINPNDIPF
jgi:hypothetical protein